jgi:Putative auto-transporter adhesin, head GIN domain
VAVTVASTPLQRQPHRRALVWIVGAFALVAIGVAIGLVIDSEIVARSSSSSAAQGSGVAATETRQVPSFTGVELAGGNNVTVRVGGERSVVVRGDDNLLSRITTQVEDGNLVVGQTPGSFETKSPTRVEVSVSSLDDLTLTGSGILTVTGIDADNVTVTLAGNGIVRASGTATRLTVALPGSGEAELKELTARDVNAVVGGSGLLLITATDRLDASVPGSGAILYTGNPADVTTSIAGSGAVIRG